LIVTVSVGFVTSIVTVIAHKTVLVIRGVVVSATARVDKGISALVEEQGRLRPAEDNLLPQDTALRDRFKSLERNQRPRLKGAWAHPSERIVRPIL